MERTLKGYCRLFYEMLIISAFTFGGGFVIVTLMQKKFVEELGWINEDEMLDLAAIAQSSPGAIAVNAAILLGRRMGGVAGVVCAVTATIIPPIVIISIISVFYAAVRDNPVISAFLKGTQAGVAAVIFDVVIGLGTRVVKRRVPLEIFLMAAVFAADYFFDVNALWIILICALAGIGQTLRINKKGGASGDIS